MSNQLSIQSICDQRRQQTMYNKPLARINMISPYETTTYTKFDLDMRRKAEILKYEKGSTKGNTLTKKQRWAQIINGNTQTLSTSANNTCIIQNKPMPLSASNVPPDRNVSVLYNDEKVPLYNFINPISTRAYGFTNTPTNINSIFQQNILSNIICESNISNKIASIIFSENADLNVYTISIHNIPLALYIQGDLSGTNINLNITDDTVINSIQLNAYYNDNLVPDRSVYRYTYSPTILQSYNLDISANTYLDGTTFKGIQYIGNLSISNILLYTSPGFIYDFKLTVNLSYFLARNTEIPSMHASIIANVTPDQIVLHSCSIQPVIPISEITDMSISTSTT
jgi:hypothetical protein